MWTATKSIHLNNQKMSIKFIIFVKSWHKYIYPTGGQHVFLWVYNWVWIRYLHPQLSQRLHSPTEFSIAVYVPSTHFSHLYPSAFPSHGPTLWYPGKQKGKKKGEEIICDYSSITVKDKAKVLQLAFHNLPAGHSLKHESEFWVLTSV